MASWDNDPIVTPAAAPASVGGGNLWDNDPIIAPAAQTTAMPVTASAVPSATPQPAPAPLEQSAETAQVDPRQKFAQDAINKFPTETEQYQQDTQARGDRGVLGAVSDFFTGDDRKTARSQNLPELSGLLQDADPLTRAKTTAALAITPSNEEDAQILKSANPNLTFDRDAAGNLIAFDTKTGEQALVNAPGASTLDALQGATGLLEYAPAGRAAAAVGGGLLKQAATLGAASAATETAVQGAQALAGGEFNPEDIAASGVLGAATPLLGGLVGSAADGVKRLVGAVRGAPGSAAPLVQAAEDAKIPLLTSDVFPPDTPIGELAQRAGERIPYAGTGAVRAEQQDARTAAVENLGAQYAPPSQNDIIDSLKSQASLVKQGAGRAIGTYGRIVDAAGPAAFGDTSAAIDSAITKLSRPGVVGSPEAVDALQRFKATLGEATQNYSSLRENRTAYEEILNSVDAAGRSQFPSSTKATMLGVWSALTNDMDTAASGVLNPSQLAKLNTANAVYSEEAKKLTKSRLKNILDKGDLTPEAAEQLLFNKDRGQVSLLYDTLGVTGRRAAKATIIQKALKDARITGEVSPERFLSSINKLQTQTGIFFKGDSAKQIEGLRQVLIATRRAAKTGITSTGQESSVPVAAAAVGSALGSFGATVALGASVGGIARVYESPLVRNALIRLGNAPKSEASKQLALHLARELNAGLQATATSAPE